MRDLEWNVFGERLSKELEKKQLSYRQFAEMVGITTTTVLRYAKCERIPRANEIIKTADVLGVTCDYLLGLSDDPHKTSMSYVIAQPEKEQLSKESTTSDLISRQAAIDEIKTVYEWHDTVTMERLIEHLNNLPTVQPEPQWIPVSERLPEPRIDVWVNSDLGQMVGYYDEMVELWYGRDYLELIVNAWMPLPTPYTK